MSSPFLDYFYLHFFITTLSLRNYARTKDAFLQAERAKKNSAAVSSKKVCAAVVQPGHAASEDHNHLQTCARSRTTARRAGANAAFPGPMGNFRTTIVLPSAKSTSYPFTKRTRRSKRSGWTRKVVASRSDGSILICKDKTGQRCSASKLRQKFVNNLAKVQKDTKQHTMLFFYRVPFFSHHNIYQCSDIHASSSHGRRPSRHCFFGGH